MEFIGLKIVFSLVVALFLYGAYRKVTGNKKLTADVLIEEVKGSVDKLEAYVEKKTVEAQETVQEIIKYQEHRDNIFADINKIQDVIAKVKAAF